MVGYHRGIYWAKHRICDILAVQSKAQYFFPYDENGKPSGNHFRTKRELIEYINLLKSELEKISNDNE